MFDRDDSPAGGSTDGGSSDGGTSDGIPPSYPSAALAVLFWLIRLPCLLRC